MNNLLWQTRHFRQRDFFENLLIYKTRALALTFIKDFEKLEAVINGKISNIACLKGF